MKKQKISKIKSNIVLDSIMTSVQTTPLEKPLLQYRLEKGSLPIVLEHFNKNKLKTISSSTKIIKYDLDKLTPYSSFTVDGKLEDDQKYTYYIHSKSYYKIVQLYKIPRHLNTDLEAFTLDYKKANLYKKQSLYNMALLEKTRFDLDVTSTENKIKENIKKYTSVESELEAQKALLENRWTAELKALYDEKSKLIHANKELYQARLKLSKEFYQQSKEEQVEGRAKFLESYRENLETYGSNRDMIVELNEKIELIEKKAGLYISETFYYYPTSILIITSANKEDYEVMLENTTKVGGSMEYSEDLEDLEDKEKVREVNKKKNVGYELEYLDIDNLEDRSESMNSHYRNIKERIKKITKKDKNIKNKELVTILTKEIVA
jgi:hypothetical protein